MSNTQEGAAGARCIQRDGSTQKREQRNSLLKWKWHTFNHETQKTRDNNDGHGITIINIEEGRVWNGKHGGTYRCFQVIVLFHYWDMLLHLTSLSGRMLVNEYRSLDISQKAVLLHTKFCRYILVCMLNVHTVHAFQCAFSSKSEGHTSFAWGLGEGEPQNWYEICYLLQIP